MLVFLDAYDVIEEWDPGDAFEMQYRPTGVLWRPLAGRIGCQTFARPSRSADVRSASESRTAGGTTNED